MVTFTTELFPIYDASAELNISDKDKLQMNEDERNVLVDIIYALAKIRRVAQQLKADRDVTMSSG